MTNSHRRGFAPPHVFALAALTVAAAAGGVFGQVATTSEDFFQPGSQPDTDPASFFPIVSATQCGFCHSAFNPVTEPVEPWSASMMGQSARDPMFYACLAVANQDAANVGEFCIRCHIPAAYLEGRSTPADGSALLAKDLEGINCNFCHRLVNPAFPTPGDGPVEDDAILAALDVEGLIPPQGSNARYIVDPVDVRRGPFDDIPTNPHPGAAILVSPLHQNAEMCWTCHDVSNPVMIHKSDGTYELDILDMPHPTADQNDMFPLHRTYSEWKNSYYFTLGGIQHNGRFGGNHLNNPDFIADGTAGIMRVCQDCHMPDQFGRACAFQDPFPVREDVPQHGFNGSNTWGLQSVRTVDADADGLPDYPDSETGLTDQSVADAVARSIEMLENASDMTLAQIAEDLRVRVTNFTGHKIPTGFPDGRQMWINVQFLDGDANLVREHGTYDFTEGRLLDDTGTKVYEILLGIDGDQAELTGLPEGPTFHFVLANEILKDNRIPPAGFSNVIAQSTGAMPIGATYLDGQNWDDTEFAIPLCATQAVVTVYYQLVKREYVEFLRDANITNNAGQIGFDQWISMGMSAPVVMDMATIDLSMSISPDLDGDGAVGILDLLEMLAAWGPTCPGPEEDCPADLDCDGLIGIGDLLALLAAWR